MWRRLTGVGIGLTNVIALTPDPAAISNAGHRPAWRSVGRQTPIRAAMIRKTEPLEPALRKSSTRLRSPDAKARYQTSERGVLPHFEAENQR